MLLGKIQDARLFELQIHLNNIFNIETKLNNC